MPRWLLAGAGAGLPRPPARTPARSWRRALEKLGPAYIKLGQMLATRPDIVGAEMAAALEHLQDRLPPFSEAQARAEITRAFGKPVEALFSSFGARAGGRLHRPGASRPDQRQPAGAGGGEDAAPRMCAKQFARDLEALALFARIAERFSAEARRLRLTAMVATLAESVALELDLRMEAAAASELYERTRGEAEFRVPHIDWTRTAASVLTSEWIDGIPLRDTAAIAAAGRDPKQVAVLVMRSFLTQALRDGFFHADMHPGNLFIDAQGRLAAVDFGIMGRLDAGMRRFMAGTLAGFLQRDYRKVAELHYEFAFVPPHHPHRDLRPGLARHRRADLRQSARDVSIARLLGQLFETTRRFDMQAQPQLVLLQKTMVVVEGVCRGLDPDFDIWEAARPVAEKMGERKYGPGSGADPRRRDLRRAGQAGPGPAATGQECGRTVPDGGGRRRAAASRHRARRSRRNRNGASGRRASR